MTTTVRRNTEGLRSALFEQMDLLRDGKSTHQQAMAVAKLAAQIISSVRVELEFFNVQQRAEKAGGANGSKFPVTLGALTLGTNPPPTLATKADTKKVA